MIILTIRTDKPKAEMGLFDDSRELTCLAWQAHRELAETIHLKLKEILITQKLALKDVEGIVVFEGPGSFTGLRIGLSVANALADSLSIPVAAAGGNNWRRQGIDRLQKDGNDHLAVPTYGAPPHITTPKR